jgi:hypothetical protein
MDMDARRPGRPLFHVSPDVGGYAMLQVRTSYSRVWEVKIQVAKHLHASECAMLHVRREDLKRGDGRVI